MILNTGKQLFNSTQHVAFCNSGYESTPKRYTFIQLTCNSETVVTQTATVAESSKTLAATMNRFLITILPLYLISCIGSVKDTTVEQIPPIKILLMDSLGSVTLQPFFKADTVFSWIRKNDCGKPCEEGRYRLQPKSYPIYKESGFYPSDQSKDSVWQLTILHSRDVYLKENDSSFAVKHQQRFKAKLESQLKPLQVTSDTLYQVGDRYFAIFRSSGFDSIEKTYVNRLDAFTSTKGNEVQFSYEQRSRHQNPEQESFLHQAEKNVQTVRFEKGG